MTPELEADLESWDVLVGRVKGRWDHSNLRIVPFSDVQNRFKAGAKLCAQPKIGERRLLEVREAKRKDGGWICDCSILTSEEADALIGAELWVHRSMRPLLPSGQFYPDEIIGMRVVDGHGEEFGEIEEVLDSPAHDIYVTNRVSIPVVPQFVVSIDGAERVVTVRDVNLLLS